MRVVRILGWIVVGAALGVLGSRMGEPVHAQYLGLESQRLFQVGDARGKFAQPRAVPAQYAFIKDSESAGCWLKFTQGEAVVIAPAPESACK
jgi:hypothetical protein